MYEATLTHCALWCINVYIECAAHAVAVSLIPRLLLEHRGESGNEARSQLPGAVAMGHYCGTAVVHCEVWEQ